ncbi:MAG: uracil-DNA glycosylase [Clostridia bacterium]|nr:uracil-DNA glycosylase [Clostridia bacterium]
MSKRDELNKLYDKYHDNFQGKEIVLGDGNVECKLMLIGEAPGKDEVRLAKPFVGAAGKNLNEFLGFLGIQREDIFITNAIKYRLSALNEKTGRIINRPATKDEVAANRDYLMEEIHVISPNLIVTLGNVPLKSVMGSYNISIGTVHGEMKEVEILGQRVNLFSLYHPASIIYNSKLQDVYMEDLKKLKDIVENI